jgi:hypothetical protein
VNDTGKWLLIAAKPQEKTVCTLNGFILPS